MPLYLNETYPSSNSLSPTAISLLGELLKLDWRKRINAIDALKHPYFTTPPLPARPGDIPQFSDSHELDRKKFRSQRAPVPPVPAVGSGDTQSNSGWGSSGSRGPDSRNSRIPGAARGGRPNVPGHGNAQRRGPFPPSQRDTGLPPRPPVPAHPPWDGTQTNRPDGRDDHRRDRYGQGRPGARAGNTDSYVPNYGNAPDRARDSSTNLTGDQTTDMITVGNQEGEVVVPVTGMGVAASHPTSACILLGDEILMMNRNEKRSCHDFCLVNGKMMVAIYIPTAFVPCPRPRFSCVLKLFTPRALVESDPLQPEVNPETGLMCLKLIKASQPGG